MDRLRRKQRILRGAVTRLLKAAMDLLQAASLHPQGLQDTIDLLEIKDAAPYETEKEIIELLDRYEVEPDYFDVLAYRENLCRALNHLRTVLDSWMTPGMRLQSNGASGKPNYPWQLTIVPNGFGPATH